MWFSGPKFLLETSPKLLQQPQEKNYPIDPSDPELEKVQVLASAAMPFITQKFTKFSTWGTLIRSIAIIQGIHKSAENKWSIKPVNQESLKAASTAVVLKTQQQHFSREMESISSNTALGKYLQERHIKFVFNTPQASHAGGVWER
ncbi:hypothetical protein EB796_015730 [Bugula neritina]|uniref:Uncharacterized protein n=1 Tax=Bugula neritina TaxID=10212 RepID=A0A7J7JK28_BUGNE|nr:hypothetical protein EB796_015730 [Bugula neritina]